MWTEIRYSKGGEEISDIRRDQGWFYVSIVLKVATINTAPETTEDHCMGILTLLVKGGSVVGLLNSVQRYNPAEMMTGNTPVAI